MSDALDHTAWRTEIAAYLLGALEPDETAALETHLEGCEHCREELRWLRPAIDLLPESVEQLDPPPQLRERLLAEVGAAGDATPQADAPRPRRTDRGLRRFFLRPAVALGAVALISAAVAGYSVGGGGDETPTTTVSAKGLGALRASLERSGDEGTLVMTGLEQAPAAHLYQTWVQHDERVEPVASLFDARNDGSASVSIPRNLEGADAVMVTIEPRGGTGKPSTTPLIDVPLSE